jgi:glucuronate isomerase
VLQHSIGIVIHHWTHLEYNRFFAVDLIAKKKNTVAKYEQLTAYIHANKISTQTILAQCNVGLVGTTDDPLDDLSYHQKLGQCNNKTLVISTFRIDKLFTHSNNFHEY